MKQINESWLIFPTVIFSILGITLGYLLPDDLGRHTELELRSVNISDCENLSIDKSVECLRDFVSPFYNYIITTDSDRTFEDIKENGGDCYDYSNLFKDLALSIDLNAETFAMYPDKGSGHMIVHIWDKNLTGYCTVGGLDVECREMIK